MPFIHMSVSKEIADSEKNTLMKAFGEAISALEGKSEQWLMIKISDDQTMCFQGNSEMPCAILEVSVYGSCSEKSYEKLTERLMVLVSEVIHIPKERIYIKYMETPFWGWNGTNF